MSTLDKFDTATAAALCVAAAIAGVAGALGPYPIYLLTVVFAYAALASSLDIVAALTGRLSFCHATFFALGAYATGVALIRTSWGSPICVALGVGAACAASIVIGIATMRLSGLYFALATMAIAVVFGSVIALPHLAQYTGGAVGLSGVQRPHALRDDGTFYWVFFGILLAVSVSKRPRRVVRYRPEDGCNPR